MKRVSSEVLSLNGYMFLLRITQEAQGYLVECDDLDCFVRGATLSEALERARERIALAWA